MQIIQLPTDRIEYLKLALPSAGPGLVAEWGTQITPFTVAAWDHAGMPTGWQLTSQTLNLAPDGEWVSVFYKPSREVRVTRVGAGGPSAVVRRPGKTDNVWTAVAPGGVAVAWKDDTVTVVSALPGGGEIARRKTGFGFDLRFSPGGRWLTERGHPSFRVLDRTNDYRVFARLPTPRDWWAGVTDGATAVITDMDRGTASVWDMTTNSATAVLPAGRWASAAAISADGRRVLTGNTECDVSLWDAGGERLRQYAWGVNTPIAAAFAADGTRAAVGGTDGRIVVWDLDE
ncbi:MAG TPA: WD40 repeat domain-containing protein [Gemmataceae bacterium]|nr:WD40 repeat domain-containing protein [Gemmataceae bacterium]